MSNALVVLPQLFLGLGAILVYGVARLITRRNGVLAGVTTSLYLLGLIATLQLNTLVSASGPVAWSPSGVQEAVFQADPGAMLITIVTLALGCVVAIYSGRYLALDHRYEYYYPLLLLLSAGLIGMVMAVDLFTIYLCTVLTSAASYILVAFRRRTETAIEAGFKYAVIGNMASIMMLAGIGFVFRSAGSLQLPLAAENLGGWGALGVALLLFSYLVKAAVFPAHTWLPDAHGRAPSSISAMLSGIVVPANMYMMIKVGLGLGVPLPRLGWLLVGLSVATTTVGNVMALKQTYGKRLLGYSSIAQVGYMMLAIGVGLLYCRPEPISAGLFLLAAHAAMKGLAFLSKGIFHFYCDASLVTELDSMAYRTPCAGACFALALAGLAGIPPLAGFMAKFHLLMSVINIGQLGSTIAMVAFIINSLISLGYYLPLIGRVLKHPDGPGTKCAVALWMQAPIVILGALVLLMGLVPNPILAQTQRAARFLLAWGPR